MLLILMIGGTILSAGAARAEIPHENYDLANPDLDTVINLLNTSIRASEEALKHFYNQTMDEASRYLAMVDSILVPAQQILSSIEHIAGSYENLTTLLPPFLGLRSEMGSFYSKELSLIDARTRLISLADLANLSDADLISAVETIRTVNSLVANMNSTIDDMLVFADEITNMTVEDRTPFKPNSLRPLIEKLRDMLQLVLAEIEPIIHNEIPWGEERAFLLLWVEDTTVYLGEEVVGGGYLFYNGSFRADRLVHVLWDGTEFIDLVTNQLGSFGFTMSIDIDASLLGPHQLMATAQTPYVDLASDELTITILLVPTYLALSLSKAQMSINETVTATLILEDVYGRPVPNSTCQLDYAGRSYSRFTDENGQYVQSWIGEELGFGTHSFSASYAGELPYAPSSAGPLTLSIAIPTQMELELFSKKFSPGYYIVGLGRLLANSSQPLEDQTIALFIDGKIMLNVSTDPEGHFAISIPSKDLVGGTHILRAAFVSHGIVWRYCEAEVTFVMTKLSPAKYPFFPSFPGWNMGPPETFIYLFFGPYAYYVWLFMLMLLVIIVKTLQIRKVRASASKQGLVATPIADLEAAALAAGAAATSATDISDWTTGKESPRDPNGRIVWLYNMLLEFLRRKRRVTITDDMTHWEVARLLRTLGYPRDNVERVTLLFERAFYSGTAMSDVDSVGMSVAMDGLRTGGARDAH